MLFLTNAPVNLCFGTLFYDASVRVINTTPVVFDFGVVFYDAPTWKSCEAPVLYSNKTHWAGVYRAHGVWRANVFCAPFLSLVECTGA